MTGRVLRKAGVRSPESGARQDRILGIALPLLVLAVALGAWQLAASAGWLPESMFPSPAAAGKALNEEVSTGRMARDVVASLLRVGIGFGLAVVSGVPAGLWLGHRTWPRLALMPGINFFRCLSPLAWIPFAVFWF